MIAGKPKLERDELVETHFTSETTKMKTRLRLHDLAEEALVPPTEGDARSYFYKEMKGKPAERNRTAAMVQGEDLSNQCYTMPVAIGGCSTLCRFFLSDQPSQSRFSIGTGN